MDFDDLDKLFAHVINEASEVANKNIARAIKNKEQEKVITDVYDKYSPHSKDGEPFRYKRRGWNDGLADTDNMEHNVNKSKDGFELTVKNVTKGDRENFEIADLVEGGDRTNGKEYEYKENRDGTAYQYLRGRHFQQATVDEMERTGEHIEIMRRELRRKGIDVE